VLASKLRAAYIGLCWAVHARGGGGCVFRVCDGGDVVCFACARARRACVEGGRVAQQSLCVVYPFM
jgi:hypothetical protein